MKYSLIFTRNIQDEKIYHEPIFFSNINVSQSKDKFIESYIKLLKKCADVLPGEHDFTSFCKVTAEVDHKLCIVRSAYWEETEEMFIFKIMANRFLQHMVRYLVGTMLEVARGRYSLTDFNNLLNNEKTQAIVLRAPAQGLYLKQVYYE